MIMINYEAELSVSHHMKVVGGYVGGALLLCHRGHVGGVVGAVLAEHVSRLASVICL